MDKDLLYKIALTLIPNIGDVNARNLISFFGTAEQVFQQSKKQLAQLPNIAEKTAIQIHKHLSEKEFLQRSAREIKFIEEQQVKVLFHGDEAYPRRLKHCHDAPVLLYYKGNADLNTSKIISVVGTRTPTEYGLKLTEQLIQDLSSQDVLIVSGLAYGVDVCAHQAALKNNLNTIGVVAHGHDRIYPSLHENIAYQMQKQGGILTEFMSETNPDRENFPKRNRIVAGMCDALVVVETRIKGGSLITAEIAHTYNRDVFAFPGRSGDELSSGCNAFIKRNKAVLIEHAADLLYAMNWNEDVPKKNKDKKQQITLQVLLNDKEQKIVEVLKSKEKVHVDEISTFSGYTSSETSGILLQLEFNNIVKSLPGKLYSLI
jgi:DNA processing protein